MGPTELIRGSCLCEAITFELQVSHQYGANRTMGFCHCTGCQRWSGGAGLPFVVAVPERFTVTKGQELMAHYRDDGSAIRAFCRRCGSSLYQDTGNTYYVSAGALEDLHMSPTFDVNTEHQPAWDHIHQPARETQ